MKCDRHIYKMAPLGHDLNCRLSQRINRLTHDTTVQNTPSSLSNGLLDWDTTPKLQNNHSCQFCIPAVPLNNSTPHSPHKLSVHKALPVPQAVLQSLLPAGRAAGEPAPRQPASAATVALAARVTAEVHDVCWVASQHLASARHLFSVGHSVASYMSHHRSANRRTYFTVLMMDKTITK